MPCADPVLCEMSMPSVGQAQKFNEGVLAQHPCKTLAYNSIVRPRSIGESTWTDPPLNT